MSNFVLISKFCELKGYTDRAVRRKLQDGIWIEGREWVRAPDGHIMIDLEAIERWVVDGRAREWKLERPASGSRSHGEPSDAERILT